ncbi:hypothetical protein Ahy_A09g042892 [Arachis hypogaea]|uniref:Uncharacterized protein n=1 Tax=Arachis hypogaea TaxID=3818 RepID=A0A445BH01_ARAHY|nr:hypothetical protein Ahy_A09g042892 [Arachis hypogaea]
MNRQKEIPQTQPQNPSTVSLPHRRKEWHTAAARSGTLPPSVALKVRHPSSSFHRAPILQPLFSVTDRGCFLELGVRRLCLLSRASVAVCLPFTFASSFSCRLRSCSSPFTFTRRSPFAFTRCSPFEFAFVWKPRCSASNSATKPGAPPSRRTALFCRRREFPKPATIQYTHTTPILCFKLCNF